MRSAAGPRRSDAAGAAGESGREHHGPSAHQPKRRGKRTRPRSGTSASTRSSPRMRPTGPLVVVDDQQRGPAGIDELLDHVVQRGVRRAPWSARADRPRRSTRSSLAATSSSKSPRSCMTRPSLVDDDHRVDIVLVLGLRPQDPADLADGLIRAHEHEARGHEPAGRSLAVEQQRPQRRPSVGGHDRQQLPASSGSRSRSASAASSGSISASNCGRVVRAPTRGAGRRAPPDPSPRARRPRSRCRAGRAAPGARPDRAPRAGRRAPRAGAGAAPGWARTAASGRDGSAPANRRTGSRPSR